MCDYKSMYFSSEARRRFAWGKYFQEINERRDDAEIIVRAIEISMNVPLNTKNNTDIILPPHITK